MMLLRETFASAHHVLRSVPVSLLANSGILHCSAFSSSCAYPQLTEAIRSLDTLSPFGFGWLSRIVSEILVDESVGFKHAAFAVEKEWRFVVRSRELLKQGTDDGDHPKLPIRFRTARGQLTPYVRLIPSGAPFPITGDGTSLQIASVRCGPVGDRISSAMAVRMLLDRYGHKAARIDRSDIPLPF